MNLEIQIPESLTNDIKALKEKLANIELNLQPKQAPQYYTRKEVAKMFNVDLSTIHNWTVKGVLTAYQIGGRVLYKANDIENAIVELKK
ncbi:helix-turn-helix domain-containing protein [Psychroflexus salis]|uniref:Helix-turn-helix domain-containing protein n=1 Tax=Psychroflexus salis TaxID=1526574 RepID=A0A917E8T9_9FLAO|nr:helix-turn-helix domain-containing protein [Psychroflexus salis]GGE12010.1 hypothetical protein GCM10010831_11810 [Psychroflexus salis]